jgi:Fic family protein
MPIYIHEQSDWHHFTWDGNLLVSQLAVIRHHQGLLIGRMQAIGFQLKAEAALQSLTEEVLKSAEIEGERLSKEQVRSSFARRLGMDIGVLTPAERDVEGFVDLMLDASRIYDYRSRTNGCLAGMLRSSPPAIAG